MLHLVHSNDTGTLGDALARRLRDGPGGTFAGADVVVPNGNVAAWLKLAIARHNGIAFDIRTRFLEETLAAALPEAMRARHLSRQELLGRLLARLDDDVALAGDALAPLRRWLDGGPEDEDARALRRWQIARRLASLYAEQAIARSDVLASWERGGVDDAPWQAHLYRRLLTDAPGMLPLPRLYAEVDPDVLDVPQQLHVFGLSYVGAGYLDMLAKLAQASEVVVYTAFPALGEGGRDDNPLSRAWGRPGRESRRLLEARADTPAEVLRVDPTASRDSLLARVQRSIVEGRRPDEDGFGDLSLRVVGCPGLQREAEVIAGTIWSLMQDDERRCREGDEPLRFTDIAVIVPERRRAAYQVKLAAAFEEQHGIPFSMNDVEARRGTPLVEGVEHLLALMEGRFARSEVLALARHPSFRAAHPGVDPVRWADWCEELGIHHGLDHADHATTYIDRDLFNWDQGLRRLALGAFVDVPEVLPGDAAGASYRVLPVDGSDEVEQAGRLAAAIRSLAADAAACRERDRTFEEWSRLLRDIVQRWLAPADDREANTFERALAKISSLRALDVEGERHPFRIAAEAVRDALGGPGGGLREGNSGAGTASYLVGGVVVASQLPMRPLPFRVVCFAGLGEGEFPIAEKTDPLDVAAGDRRPGDVSWRESELYMFLEALAFTRDHVVLSWVHHDETTGEPIEPSPVVRDVLAAIGADDDFAVRHPRDRHAPCYFSGGTRSQLHPMHSPAAAREHRVIGLRRSLLEVVGEAGFPRNLAALLAATAPSEHAALKRVLGVAEPPEPADAAAAPTTPLRISLSRIRQFLECPLQASVKQHLRLPEDEEDVAEHDDEAFAVDPIPQAMTLRRVFDDLLAAGTLDDGLARRAALAGVAEEESVAGAWPTGVFGRVVEERFDGILGGWAGGLGRADGWRRVWFGHADEDAVSPVIVPAIALDVDLPGGETRRVEIHGRSEWFQPEACRAMFNVAGAATHVHHLRLFVSWIALAAGGHVAEEPWSSVVLAGRGKPKERSFVPVTREAARAWLHDRVCELLSGIHDHLLPAIALLPTPPDDVGDAVRKLFSESNRARFSTTYGPARVWSLLEPPSESDVASILERRFGLFLAGPAEDEA